MGITPQTIYKSRDEILSSTSIADVRKKESGKDSAFAKVAEPVLKFMSRDQKEDLIAQLTEEMHNAAKDLEFERAATLRDEIERLTKLLK
jgi:excinuclease ABC subunit B